MNQDQLRAVLDEFTRSGKKVPPFSSADPVEWKTWRSNFEIAARINRWNHARQRREIGASMEGTAKMYVGDIPLGDEAAPNQPVQPAAQLLDAYQAVFVPEANAELARVQLQLAKQTETETITQWHARLRHLYSKAHPQLNYAQVEAEQHLRDLFILGLAAQKIKENTWNARPATYQACLAAAQGFQATALILDPTQNPSSGGSSAASTISAVKEEAGTNQISDECDAIFARTKDIGRSTARCSGKPSSMLNRGSLYNDNSGSWRKERATPSRGRRGQGRRGRASGNRGGMSRPLSRARIAQLEEILQELGVNDEEGDDEPAQDSRPEGNEAGRE
jgi:hypothetical protein